MPVLPSGLRLGLVRDALFDPGVNWFTCPEGHFWYWTPGPEAGLGPFPPGHEILQIPRHAPVPTSIEEVGQYIRVIVFDADMNIHWPGEWLASCPTFVTLDDADLAAWRAWLAEPKTVKFLEDTITRCQELAISSRGAKGYAVIAETGEPTADGWMPGAWDPDKRWP